MPRPGCGSAKPARTRGTGRRRATRTARHWSSSRASRTRSKAGKRWAARERTTEDRMKQRQVGPIVILAPKGYLTGGDETEELEQTIKTLAEGGNKALVVNLAETQHL